MNRSLVTLLLATALAGSAVAQTAPVGGPDARGNSPIKAPHTVNAGSAKPAANSFTRGEAMKHIEHSGYTGVSGLTKGRDGVWRGTAMKSGAPVNVAMDFKGNVTEGMAPTSPRRTMAPASAAAPMDGTASAAATPMTPEPHRGGHRRHHRHWRHHHHHRSGGKGVGMSGVDRNKNGISDKEDRALARH